MDELIAEIKTGLPKNWMELSPELKLEALLLSADTVLKPNGDFILLNANMTVRELLTPPDPPA